MLRPQAEPLIEFVHSREKLKSLPGKKPKQNKNIRGQLSGKEVRTLYESVIFETADNNPAARTVTNEEDGDADGDCISQIAIRSNDFIRHDKKHSSRSNPSPYSNGVCKQIQFESNECKKSDLVNVTKTFQGKISKKDQCQIQMLHCCQNGDVDGVVECVDAGVDVSDQDQYGWSPLMCAACAGHLNVVKLLLDSGADWTSLDKSGKTARDLAERGGHKKIAQIIDEKSGGYASMSTSEDLDSQVVLQDEEFYCDVCKKRFTEVSVRSHSTSTLHLFNRQLEPPVHDYLISESNVGYQMMLRSGWVESQGLGPRGQGHKFPVKTVLKRNREGLGREKTSSPRVTHFRPGDTAAVRTTVPRGERRESMRSISRREMRKREKRDKDWEIRLRRYMNSE